MKLSVFLYFLLMYFIFFGERCKRISQPGTIKFYFIVLYSYYMVYCDNIRYLAIMVMFKNHVTDINDTTHE